MLVEQESFYRLLRRATNPDPGRRFVSAGDMADQLTGVLREVLAVGDGRPRPAFSSVFSPELQGRRSGGRRRRDRALGSEVTPRCRFPRWTSPTLPPDTSPR